MLVAAFESGDASVSYEHDPVTDVISSVTLVGGETGVSVAVYVRGVPTPMTARAEAGQTETLPVTGLTLAAVDHAEAASPPND